MTTVTFYQSNQVLYGFSTEGHTGYADAGSDILCAAISSLTVFVVNTIETELSVPAVIEEREDGENNARITLEVPALFSETLSDADKYAVGHLIESYRRHLEEMAGDYPKYIRVLTREKEVR